jgi:hypothetical protein
LLVKQPGNQDVHRYILIAANASTDLVVAYTPAGGDIRLDSAALASGLVGTWCNPRTGERRTATPSNAGNQPVYTTPDNEDWLLVLQSSRLQSPQGG